MNIYAVGDVHGCFEKLIAAVAKIKAHANCRPYRVVFLGDYVDRGPASRDVVNLISALCDSPEWWAVLGNHEAMLLKAVAERGELNPETLRSYENHETDLVRHCEWFRTLPLMIQSENHVFVHAGCSRRYALDKQPTEVMLWIRRWEADNHDFGKHVVYGHTARKHPVFMKHSTGLDTGAVFGGVLSVGVFDSEKAGGPLEVFSLK